MLVHSFSATKDRTCKTISLKKVPIRSLPRRVSSNGISISLHIYNSSIHHSYISITKSGISILPLGKMKRRICVVFSFHLLFLQFMIVRTDIFIMPIFHFKPMLFALFQAPQHKLFPNMLTSAIRTYHITCITDNLI